MLAHDKGRFALVQPLQERLSAKVPIAKPQLTFSRHAQ